MLRRVNPAAGVASLVWLLIVVVPVYVMVNASLMPQGEALGGKLLEPAPHATLANYRLVLRSGFFHLLLNNVIVSRWPSPSCAPAGPGHCSSSASSCSAWRSRRR